MKRKILLVEMDHTNRLLGQHYLKRGNNEVYTATTFEEAEEAMKKHANFDVVISGERLPGDKKGTDVIGYAKGSQPGALTILVILNSVLDVTTHIVARELKIDEVCSYIELPDMLLDLAIIQPRGKSVQSHIKG